MVINHLEPDHAASINQIVLRHPDVKIVSTEKAEMMFHQFGYDPGRDFITVKEGDTVKFGKHEVTFLAAPMVHWPEAMVTLDLKNGCYSAPMRSDHLNHLTEHFLQMRCLLRPSG